MPNGEIFANDGDGQTYRVETYPVKGGRSVLLRITGPRPPMCLELSLRDASALDIELGIAHTRALSLQDTPQGVVA